MLNQRNSKGTASTTSLPELADGHLQLDLLESVSQSESSPDHRPASHSAQQGSAADTATNDTLHPTGSAWSQPSGLIGSLASKWQPQSEKTTGSMIYSMHWKEKATPRGRSYCQLVASAHRTSGKDCGSLHGWPTPTTRDYRDHANLSTSMKRPSGVLRKDVTSRVLWIQMFGDKPLSPSKEQMGDFVQCHKKIARELMGYPTEWAQYAPTEMPSSRKSRQK